jgi:hypothetical protein
MAGNAWSGDKGTSGSATLSNLTAMATYTLICTGDGGSTTSSIDIAVAAAPAPTLDFAADSTKVSRNSSVNLDWSASNADSCVATSAEDNDWNGSKPMKGTYKTKPIAKQSSFMLVCTGAGDPVTRVVTVLVDDGKSSGGTDGGTDGGGGATTKAADKKVGGGALDAWAMLMMLAFGGYGIRRRARSI